jgi:hypothetical protein
MSFALNPIRQFEFLSNASHFEASQAIIVSQSRVDFLIIERSNSKWVILRVLLRFAKVTLLLLYRVGKSGKNDPTTNHHGDHGSGIGSYRRRAHHAGSWYDSDADTSQETLSGFLGAVDSPTGSSSSLSSTAPTTPSPRLRAIVVHAGYSYSGPTVAYAYAALQTELTTTKNTDTNTKSPIRQILVLHPSHHIYLKGSAVSGASILETPVGSLAVDDDLGREILGLSNKFTVMELGVDEREHSGEMQYPYLAQILKTVATATATGYRCQFQSTAATTRT